MNKKKLKKFIDLYEKVILEHRENYYKNILANNNKKAEEPNKLLHLIPIALCLYTIIFHNFTFLSYIDSLIIVALFGITISAYKTLNNTTPLENYSLVLRKNGFLNIEDFEKKLKKYITGQNGYYTILLNEITKKYNLNEETTKVQTTSGEEYYLWYNKNKDKMYLLNTKTSKRPKIVSIPLSDIRYYRINHSKKELILKTSNDNYYFKEKYQPVITEFIKTKRLENIKEVTPELHIDDFEIFMHTIKRKKEDKLYVENKIYRKSINLLLGNIFMILIFLVLTCITKETKLLNIINILLIIGLYFSLSNILSRRKPKKQSEDDLIRELNSDPECIARFNELKYALGVKDTYSKIYTPEKVEYTIWVSNNYFHLFLNLIYYNVVFMVVKSSDVLYHKQEKDRCILKLKNKTLQFNKHGIKILKKVLPTKEYEPTKIYEDEEI